MKIPRPSTGRIVLLSAKGGGGVSIPAIVIRVDEADPLLIEVQTFPIYGVVIGPVEVHYSGASRCWRYPPREDRTIDVPDEAA